MHADANLVGQNVDKRAESIQSSQSSVASCFYYYVACCNWICHDYHYKVNIGWQYSQSIIWQICSV